MIDFTVLIPVFNTQPHHLLEAAYSIANQRDIQDFNVLLVDDCSTEINTIKMLKFLDNKKIGKATFNVHYRDENGGTSAALNTGHDIIGTEYIAIMGSDDISHSLRLKIQTDWLLSHPEIDVLGCNLFSYYDDDFTREAKFTSRHVYRVNPADSDWLTNHGTVIYKNQKVRDVGGYDLSKRRAQDIELWGRMHKAGAVICNLSDVLYAWRRFR